MPEIYLYYSNGYIVENVTNGTDACSSWLLLPAENLWSPELRAILYIIGMLYLFIGVAIGSDVFMTSIEVITSKKRCVVLWDEEKQTNITKEVFIWNETVANLTLLALGSSAPEILLATIETVTEISNGKFRVGEGLGFYTIMGSAAFNLLVITAICIMSVKSPDVKRLKELGVFILTAIWSLLAYVWLLACVKWFSPGEIEIWEAVVTLLFFPLLVLTAYAQDNNWWMHKCRKKRVAANEPVTFSNGDAHNSIVLPTSKSPERPPKRLDFHKMESMDGCQGEGKDVFVTCTNSNGNGNNNPEAIEKGKTSNPTPVAHAQTADEFDQMTSPHGSYKPFARARFRHAAIRALGGSSRRPIENSSEIAQQVSKQPPKLLSIVATYAETNKIYTEKSSMNVKASSYVAFASPSYSVMENAGHLHVDILLHRRSRMKPLSSMSSITENGEAKNEKQLSNAVSIVYETREGSAKANKDFKYSTGKVVFTEESYVERISIPIINDDQYNPDTDFYILLKNPEGDVCLGDPSVCRVTIIDDDKPGDFVLESAQLYADMESGIVQAVVMRRNGSDGNVSIDYVTVDGTAKGGEKLDDDVDYISTSGTLPFKHNEESKTITLHINKNCKGQKNFVLVLRNPSPGSHLGEHSAGVVNINVNPSTGIVGPSYVLGSEEDEDTWGGQIKGAMSFGRDYDENGEFIIPEKFEYFLHFLAFLWKVVFAFVPPKTLWGGYPAFFISLAFIAVITSIIEQLGTLLGCAVVLHPAVTGILLIALGTSVPDTFASRTAALHHDCADAAIGNITGSNSVNVFLGLGLPWLIRSCYHKYWDEKYLVTSTSIEFSVILFDCLGAVCIVLLLVRRRFVGGELGGTFKMKVLSSSFLALLWVIYVIVVSLKAYEFF